MADSFRMYSDKVQYKDQSANVFDRADMTANLGGNTNNRDMAFSLMWDKSLSKGSSTNISFRHGIALASNDSNLSGVTLNINTSSKFHVNQLDLWIQSGADSHEGMYITIGEMMNYSKHNILEQTGQSMLANANQSADGILTLLG